MTDLILPLAAQVREHLHANAQTPITEFTIDALVREQRKERAKWDRWLAEFGAYWTVHFG